MKLSQVKPGTSEQSTNDVRAAQLLLAQNQHQVEGDFAQRLDMWAAFSAVGQSNL